MGNKLHKLGAVAFTYPWRFISGWLIIVAILGSLAAYFMQPASSSISIPGTEAQLALNRANELFPDSGKGSARIVFEVPNGSTIQDYRSQITDLAKTIRTVDGVTVVVSPFDNPAGIAKSNQIAYMQLQLDGGAGSVSKTTIAEIEKDVDDARKNNLTVEMGGDIIDPTPGEIIGVGEIGGVAVALMVLLMTLGSLVAAGMPIATALVAVAASMGGLFALGGVIEIGSTTPVLAVMLGLAVGIDYSLFIINKYRTYAKDGYSYKDAAARAIGTAGNAVLFAAATVVIALSALSIVNVPFMTTMGLAGAATIALAAIVAVTLIPALLGLAGHRVFPRKNRKAVLAAQKRGPIDTHAQSRNKFWYRWGEMLTKHPVIALTVGVLVIAVLALPVKNLTLGLPTDEYAATDTTQRKAYEILKRGFGAGFNGPLLVVAEGLPAVSEEDKTVIREPAMRQYEEKVAEETTKQQAAFAEQMAQVTSPEQAEALQQQASAAQTKAEQQKATALADIEKAVEQYAKLVQLKKVSDLIAQRQDVEAALPAMATEDGTKGLIQIIPASSPADQKTIDLISYLRDTSHRKELTGSNSVSLAVTGSTALQTDINKKLADALPTYLSVVIGLSLILLLIAFRSVLVPIKATIGFLLSVIAMFGIMVAVFQWGWFGIADAPGPIVSFVPIIAIGVLFGLAMDYEFFLVSSMHETYQKTKNAKKAVVDGFGLGSKVVTAAGIIMVAVFAGFVSNHDNTVQTIGFGLACGILIDAFIVRMTIVPAVMTLLGKKAWWLPKWLDKRLPHVSIEGEAEGNK